MITLKQQAVNTNTMATNVFKFILLFVFILCLVENTISYSYKFSRVLIFAQIRAEKLNAQKLIRKFTLSKDMHEI